VKPSEGKVSPEAEETFTLVACNLLVMAALSLISPATPTTATSAREPPPPTPLF
jgi:hypothetical protein